MSPEFVTLIAPMAGLLLASILLPALLVPRGTLSQRRLALGMAASALALLALGAALFAGLYALAGARVFAALAEEPFGVAGHLAGASLRAAPFWLPVLALVWLIRAQGVERRRGEALAEAGRAGVAQRGGDA